MGSRSAPDIRKGMRVMKLRVRELLWLLSGLLLLAVTALLSVTSDVYDSLHAEDKYRSQVTNKENVPGTYNPSLLSHRLIHRDETQGVTTSEQALRAYGNTSRFLDEVKSQCHSEDTNAVFFRCANAILGKNFYYRPSNPVTPAWAAGYSDCDLNVYLLLDAAASAGKTANIVYAPGHAFLAFISEKTGEQNYWETTAGHNNGAMANLDAAFYRKTLQHFYYSPFPAQIAEQLYPALIIDEAGQESALKLLTSLLLVYPGNPLLTDQFYSHKPGINAGDIEKIEDLLKTDISSVSKKIIVARYFADRGESDEALNFLNRINDNHCGSECLNLKQLFSWYYRAMFMAINIAKEQGVIIPFPVLSGAIAHIPENLYDLMFLLLYAVVPALTVTWLLSLRRQKPLKSASTDVLTDMFSGSQEPVDDKQDTQPLSSPEK